MAFDLQILSDKIEKIKESFNNGTFSGALVGALKTGQGFLEQRVFQANEDIEGNSFGIYIGKKTKVKTKGKRTTAELFLTAYQKKRQKAGRQINKKDLEFTGALRRSIETEIENENAAILEFNNSLAAKIAKGQESQITNIRNGRKGVTRGTGVKIFKLSTQEKNEVNEQGAELIKQILDRK